MLLLTSSLKLVAEIALLALAGQWLLGLLAGAQRDGNLVYRLLQVLTLPFVRAARWLAPRAVADARMPLLAAVLLLALWLAATLFKIRLCLEQGLQTCR